MLSSEDGGATWSEAGPPDPPALTRCGMLADGTVAVAGEDGFFAVR